jgi:transposase-like protein
MQLLLRGETLNIQEDLAYNIMTDWKKRNISPKQKSDFIKAYLEQEDISIRELARQLNTNYSTLQDWVSMRQTNNEKTPLDTLIDRLTFLLSKDFTRTPKTTDKLIKLKNELERNGI